MSGKSLVRYDAMCRAIDAAHKVDEVKDIRDKAIALEHYARQALNTDAERLACEIRLRAERKAGQLLTKMKVDGARRPQGQSHVDRHDMKPTLDDFGISRDQSSQWQKLGEMSQRDFNLAIGTETLPTTKGILRQIQQESNDLPPQPYVEKDALRLCGSLKDFEREGWLDKKPEQILKTMTPSMLDSVHRLAPKVAAWLKRIGAEHE